MFEYLMPLLVMRNYEAPCWTKLTALWLTGKSNMTRARRAVGSV